MSGNAFRAAPAALLAAALLAGCGTNAGAPAQTTLHDLGPIRAGVTLAPDPPATGENVMTVVVKDAAGRPVRGAAVQVIVSMPSMGSMPRMESRGTVRESGAGVYRAAYGLSMAGDWDVSVRVTPPGGTAADGAWRISTSREGAEFTGGARGARRSRAGTARR